jgi:glutamyl-tRNA synthetase/glutamyl-Q tRNA(Asp) synthetase
VTRFAPAPTGYLHLGHVANAIYVWGLASRLRSDVLLRIEDHDRQRSRPAYEAALLDDLDWLGFVPDPFPTSAFRARACESRQSDRDASYRAAAAPLVARGLIYGCVCTRVHAQPSDNLHGPGPRRYRGTCRERGIAPGEGVTWRVRMDARPTTFDDVLYGQLTQTPADEFGDPVIRDRLGNWSYQFAVTVDDHRQGVDLVVRGQDLLPSTALQIQLGELLGRERPARFAHHPLIMKSPGQKLSKSNGDAGIRALRAAGWTARRVLGHAAWRVGLTDAEHEIWPGDLAGFFTDL